jgi:hypothetical protein
MKGCNRTRSCRSFAMMWEITTARLFLKRRDLLAWNVELISSPNLLDIVVGVETIQIESRIHLECKKY